MTDTTPPSVLNRPAGKRWARVPAAIGLVGLAAVAVSSLVPSELFATAENTRLGEDQPAPYARIPASAESVNDRVEYGELPDDVEVFETADDFFFVTVSQPEQSVLSWVLGSSDPVVDLLTEEGRNGRRTPSQNRQLGLQQMRTATQEAQFVALSVAGYEPTIEQGVVVVQDILCRVPADDGFECAEQFPSGDVLEPGDTILEIDDVPVATVEELGAELAGLSPGDEVDMLIDRAGAALREVSVELSADPTDPDRTIVGFAPFDTRSVDLPFDVAIDTAAVGGPSAGLAFTLALIDELTEGDLTPGDDVAVTGTIRLDGSVGPIGGLEQKVSAVKQHGVSTFIVPADQLEFSEPDSDRPDDGICRMECLLAAGDGEVELIPVATLDEALEVLESLGGDPLVPVEAG